MVFHVYMCWTCVLNEEGDRHIQGSWNQPLQVEGALYISQAAPTAALDCLWLDNGILSTSPYTDITRHCPAPVPLTSIRTCTDISIHTPSAIHCTAISRNSLPATLSPAMATLLTALICSCSSIVSSLSRIYHIH